jgi:hypothetical protein
VGDWKTAVSAINIIMNFIKKKQLLVWFW